MTSFPSEPEKEVGRQDCPGASDSNPEMPGLEAYLRADVEYRPGGWESRLDLVGGQWVLRQAWVDGFPHVDEHPEEVKP